MKDRKVLLTGICLMLAILVGCFLLTNHFSQNYQDTAAQQLEDVIRQIAATCYGTEGFYPPDVAYMQAHYGLQYDADAYRVHYEVFASNLMPEITVVEKNQ